MKSTIKRIVALVALGVFFSLVFYFGWDGGKVGEALAGGLHFFAGKVAALTPLLMLGGGAGLMLRPALPEQVRPRAGTMLLVLALMLGFAAGSFGLGPSHPARHGFFHQTI